MQDRQAGGPQLLFKRVSSWLKSASHRYIKVWLLLKHLEGAEAAVFLDEPGLMQRGIRGSWVVVALGQAAGAVTHLTQRRAVLLAAAACLRVPKAHLAAAGAPALYTAATHMPLSHAPPYTLHHSDIFVLTFQRQLAAGKCMHVAWRF